MVVEGQKEFPIFSKRKADFFNISVVDSHLAFHGVFHLENLYNVQFDDLEIN